MKRHKDTKEREREDRSSLNTICYNMLKSYLYIATVKTRSSAAVSCTICTNFFLFPVTLCTFVQETAASRSQFA